MVYKLYKRTSVTVAITTYTRQLGLGWRVYTTVYDCINGLKWGITEPLQFVKEAYKTHLYSYFW